MKFSRNFFFFFCLWRLIVSKLALVLLLLSPQSSTNTFTPYSLSYTSGLHLWLLGKNVLSLGKQDCGVSNVLSYRGFCIAAPDGSPRNLCKYSHEWKLLSYFAGICNSFYSRQLFSCWGCSHKGRINIQSARAWDAPACVMKPSSYFSWWTFKETSVIKGKVTPWGNRKSGYLFTKLRKPLVAGDIHTLCEELKWIRLTLFAQRANASPVDSCLVLFNKRSKIEVQPTACCKEFHSLRSFLKCSSYGDNVWKCDSGCALSP